MAATPLQLDQAEHKHGPFALELAYRESDTDSNRRYAIQEVRCAECHYLLRRTAVILQMRDGMEQIIEAGTEENPVDQQTMFNK